MAQRTILCALENRDLARIFEGALKGEGYRFESAHDGEQLICQWREERPDLVILDISLSKHDGFEVLEMIQQGPGSSEVAAPVILLSDSRITPHYQERADSLGVDLLLAKPVPLDQLLDCVGELIKPDTPPSQPASTRVATKVATKSEAKTAPRNSKPMAGTFAELPFPRLLHQLHGLRTSGVLLLANGRKRKAIELRDGVPVAIKSNLVHECLGNFLVRHGKLREEDQNESAARIKRGEGLQGEILVAMELVDEETIAEALREQALEKLLEIFEWENGQFRLELRSKIKRANSLALNSSPANVILEGVRQKYPIGAVDRFLAANRERFLRRAENPFYRFQDVDLSEEESELVNELVGTPELEKYVTSSENARRGLFGLLATGLLSLQNRSGEAVEPLASTADPSAQRTEKHGEKLRDEVAERSELTDLVNSLRDKNYFEMLGVSKACPNSVLEDAYSQLARRVHPDRFQSASLAIREIAGEVYNKVLEAYETLRDKKSRQLYVLELQVGQRRVQVDQEGRRAFEAETAFQKGTSLLQKRAYEEALLQFGKALERNDQDGEYHAYYGWCLYQRHPDSSTMVEEAIEHVKRGASLAPDQEKPCLFLGRLYKVMGKVSAAERMFTRAVQIQPECVEALRELRLINLRRDKGKGLLRRMLRR